MTTLTLLLYSGCTLWVYVCLFTCITHVVTQWGLTSHLEAKIWSPYSKIVGFFLSNVNLVLDLNICMYIPMTTGQLNLPRKTVWYDRKLQIIYWMDLEVFFVNCCFQVKNVHKVLTIIWFVKYFCYMLFHAGSLFFPMLCAHQMSLLMSLCWSLTPVFVA